MELIVVLLILAILAALLLPSLTGYITRAQDSSLIAQCRQVVVAGQSVVSELYASKNLKYETLQKNLPRILEMAEVKGSILEITYASGGSQIEVVLYKAPNGKYVLYKDKTYTVYDDLPEAYSIIGYLGTSKELLQKAIDTSTVHLAVWENLRKLYNEQMGGTTPKISQYEKNMLPGISQATVDELTWKPAILGDKSNPTDILMIASHSTSSINNAYLIYYNGTYYSHYNEYNRPDSAFVTDQGGFDLTLLTSGKPDSNGGIWKEVQK